MPARRSRSAKPQRRASAAVAERHDRDRPRRGRRLVASIMPAARCRPPSRRRASAGRPCSRDQPVIAAAAQHRALGAEIGRSRTRRRCGSSSRGRAPGAGSTRYGDAERRRGRRVTRGEEIAARLRSGGRRRAARWRSIARSPSSLESRMRSGLRSQPVAAVLRELRRDGREIVDQRRAIGGAALADRPAC